MINEDDADEIPEGAIDELLDTEEEDDLDLDLKDPIDEFGAGGDDDAKSRDWE